MILPDAIQLGHWAWQPGRSLTVSLFIESTGRSLYSGSQKSEVCSMPYALCPVVPHLSEKGYILGRGDIKPEQLFIPDDAFRARLGGIFINGDRPASV